VEVWLGWGEGATPILLRLGLAQYPSSSPSANWASRGTVSRVELLSGSRSYRSVVLAILSGVFVWK
jgi:hypothetical protein